MSKKTKIGTPSPGPWVLERNSHGQPRVIRDCDGEFISYITESRFYDDRDDPVAEANAHVLTASWELLEVARAVLEPLTQLGMGASIIRQIKQAIDKAEGV